MKNIFKIFIRDLKNISKNRAALIIIIGICIIPSLYAWINLKACWDPYANTGNLPVAVVNEDQGVVLNGKEMNIGDKIIDELKDNKEIDWQFVTNQQGEEGVKKGEYYAMIEIPSNFSSLIANMQNVGSKKPDIIYLVNEKANAIATKITDIATARLTEEIKSNMISAVTEAAGGVLNQIGDKLQQNKLQLIQFKDDMLSASSSIKSIEDYMNNVSSDAKNFSNYLGVVKNDTSSITSGLNSLESVATSSKELITSASMTLNSLGDSVENNINNIQDTISQAESYIDELKAMDYDVKGNKEAAINLMNNITNSLNTANGYINKSTKILKMINEISPSNKVEEQIESLNKLETTITDGIPKLAILKDKVNSMPEVEAANNVVSDGVKYETAKKESANNIALGNELSSTAISENNVRAEKNLNNNLGKTIDLNGVNTALNNVLTTLEGVSSALENISTNYSQNVLPAINTLANNLNDNINNASTIVSDAQGIVPAIKEISNTGIEMSGEVLSTADELDSGLSNFSGSLNNLNSKLSVLNNNTLNSAINLLEKNTNGISDFLSSPINVETENIYNSATFGEGLTPFYTVLAIWVGALLLTSLLTVECEEDLEEGKKVKLIEKHFGKMLLFIFLSLIQTTIVTIGDKFVLGVNPSNMAVTLGFAFLSSITFTIIIFTLVSLFENIGKAICILIMVFQIAGSGGIYPIQTNPKIFQILQPIWPFTYAIDGFRQGIAGVVWSEARTAAIALVCFMVVFLILSLLKKPLHHITEFMSKRFKESGL